MRRALVAALAAFFILPAPTADAAHYHPANCSAVCVERVKHRIIRKQERAEWREYKANPMPWCTWGPESGEARGEWALARYRQPAIGQGPDAGGGKFQIRDPTWIAYGGGAYASTAYRARPLHQERVARRIAYAGTVEHEPQGLSAWTNC